MGVGLDCIVNWCPEVDIKRDGYGLILDEVVQA